MGVLRRIVYWTHDTRRGDYSQQERGWGGGAANGGYFNSAEVLRVSHLRESATDAFGS